VAYAPGVIAATEAAALPKLRAVAPAGVELRDLASDPLEGVEFIVPYWSDVIRFDELADLRVVQVLSAGTDWIEDRVPPGVVLCNARGARDVAVAEWAVAALTGAATGLLRSARGHDRHEWSRFQPSEVAGSTVLIVGLGSIGQAVRRRLEALRATVIGVAREARPGVHGAEDLPALLPRADAVLVLTPLTDATRGVVDAAFLARMRDGALLLNAGRGAVVDTDALLAELGTGRLQAVLDVVDPEPLPADHPLWDAPGLIALTPHVAGDTAASDDRALRFAGHQLARYARGEPLRNVVQRSVRAS
jgi:phosphoglycerate dehydrogenase-like enzyme